MSDHGGTNDYPLTWILRLGYQVPQKIVSETGQIKGFQVFRVSGPFLKNTREYGPEMWRADVSWPPTELSEY